ncbi:MAG: TAXI family TRAP transporter solute-binding subunit [Pseudomonadota bacterium]
MKRVRAFFVLFVVCCLFGVTSVRSQQNSSENDPSNLKKAPASQALIRSETEAEVKRRKNAWTVGLATGQIEASYPPLAQDLTKVLDDGENLRVLPIITYGSVGNVEDLLYLNNVDMAFTKSDSFAYFEKLNVPNLYNRIHYIARLYDAEMHILVGPDIKTIKDLEGKTVNFGLQGNAANVTAPIMFERLGITVKPISVDHDIGIEMLKKGEISAALRVAGKPATTFRKVPPGTNLRFLGVSSTEYATHFSDLYVLGKLTNEDYPNLVPKGQVVSTFAVPDILVTYNWSRKTSRYKRVERFITAFFNKFDKLRKPPFHKKWRDVNLAATLRGKWKRFEVAERMLQRKLRNRRTASKENRVFSNFLKTKNSLSQKLSNREREALFLEYRAWLEQR